MQIQSLPNSIANLTQPTRYIRAAETAKLIRVALKQAFPEVKFSVVTDSYSGGASIRIRWVDGPQTKQVEPIAKRFSGASFDGMQDLKSYKTHAIDGQPVRFSADYVFCSRDQSDEARANMLAVLEGMTTDDRQQLLYRLDGIHYSYKGTDDVRQLAHAIFHAMPQPAFDGRRSALAETVTMIDAGE
jgi:hypothetical protein